MLANEVKGNAILCVHLLLKGFCACGLIASQNAMVAKVCEYSHSETFETTLDSRVSVIIGLEHNSIT